MATAVRQRTWWGWGFEDARPDPRAMRDTVVGTLGFGAEDVEDPVELGAITRALNGAYEGMVEWWEDHPEIEPGQLTEWIMALVLPGLREMSEAAAG